MFHEYFSNIIEQRLSEKIYNCAHVKAFKSLIIDSDGFIAVSSTRNRNICFKLFEIVSIDTIETDCKFLSTRCDRSLIDRVIPACANL